jgi:uncharacterized membrane protein YGL010W
MSPTNRTPSLVSPRLANYFKDYSLYHKTRGNQLTHYLGIPLIVISVLGLLANLTFGLQDLTGSPYFRIDGGSLLFVAGVIWYLFLDWKLTSAFSLVLVGFYFLGRVLPLYVNWSIFVLGWILQGIGHAAYEKKSPAFFRNITHLLIGPIWIFSKSINYK